MTQKLASTAWEAHSARLLQSRAGGVWLRLALEVLVSSHITGDPEDRRGEAGVSGARGVGWWPPAEPGFDPSFRFSDGLVGSFLQPFPEAQGDGHKAPEDVQGAGRGPSPP